MLLCVYRIPLVERAGKGPGARTRMGLDHKIDRATRPFFFKENKKNPTHNLGALDGGSTMSPVNFKNAHVPCHYFCNVYIDSKKVSYRMSNLRNTPCDVVYFILLSQGSMSQFDFKKWPCRRVEFKGQDPQQGNRMQHRALKIQQERI